MWDGTASMQENLLSRTIDMHLGAKVHPARSPVVSSTTAMLLSIPQSPARGIRPCLSCAAPQPAPGLSGRWRTGACAASHALQAGRPSVRSRRRAAVQCPRAAAGVAAEQLPASLTQLVGAFKMVSPFTCSACPSTELRCLGLALHVLGQCAALHALAAVIVITVNGHKVPMECQQRSAPPSMRDRSQMRGSGTSSCCTTRRSCRRCRRRSTLKPTRSKAACRRCAPSAVLFMASSR